MKRMKRYILAPVLAVAMMATPPARADFWGGDLIYLAQILQTAIQQLTQLQNILGNGRDTLNLLRDVNRGLRDALRLMRTANQTLNPGVLSDLDSLDQILFKVEELYGRIPNTPEGKMQVLTDRSVAEAINLHNEAFKYANRLDPEAERIKDYAHMVNPAGAAKVTVQSMGIMIHVLNQILRTNAAILKLQSEQLALQNRRGKLDSEQFKMQYEGVSEAFGRLQPTYSLPRLGK